MGPGVTAAATDHHHPTRPCSEQIGGCEQLAEAYARAVPSGPSPIPRVTCPGSECHACSETPTLGDLPWTGMTAGLTIMAAGTGALIR